MSITEISWKEYNVHEINSIQSKYPKLRQDSKAPTFALTYQGTYLTLMKNCGFSEEQAKAVEKRYHELYQVSDQWVRDKLKQACTDGFVSLAFGLKLRTPLLHKSLMDTSFSTVKDAQKEARTAGNALSGQSYGLLNNRAVVAFMKRVWASEWKYDIVPVALIHDAIYLMIKDDVRCIKFVNDVLIEEMSWQELPELKHDKIKLGAELDLFCEDWAHPITLKNGASVEDIEAVIKASKEKPNG